MRIAQCKSLNRTLSLSQSQILIRVQNLSLSPNWSRSRSLVLNRSQLVMMALWRRLLSCLR